MCYDPMTCSLQRKGAPEDPFASELRTILSMFVCACVFCICESMHGGVPDKCMEVCLTRAWRGLRV